jgi:hypothetical protein
MSSGGRSRSEVRSDARDGLTNSEELTSVLYIYMLLTLAMA